MPHNTTPFIFDCTCSRDDINALEPVVMADFARVAEEYTNATGQRLIITSAKRSLKRMAEIMAALSDTQLEGMYCRNGYPDYIRNILAARKTQNTPLSSEQIYIILKNRQEGYISTHLFGGAIDIATDNLINKTLLQTLLNNAGFTTLDENNLGIHCLHASHTKVNKQIIRN